MRLGLHHTCTRRRTRAQTQLCHTHACRLAKLFATEGLEVAMFSTCWFNTIFAYCLPFSHLLRIWDIFMLEGMKIVFRCAWKGPRQKLEQGQRSEEGAHRGGKEAWARIHECKCNLGAGASSCVSCSVQSGWPDPLLRCVLRRRVATPAELLQQLVPLPHRGTAHVPTHVLTTLS